MSTSIFESSHYEDLYEHVLNLTEEDILRLSEMQDNDHTEDESESNQKVEYYNRSEVVLDFYNYLITKYSSNVMSFDKLNNRIITEFYGHKIHFQYFFFIIDCNNKNHRDTVKEKIASTVNSPYYRFYNDWDSFKVYPTKEIDNFNSKEEELQERIEVFNKIIQTLKEINLEIQNQ